MDSWAEGLMTNLIEVLQSSLAERPAEIPDWLEFEVSYCQIRTKVRIDFASNRIDLVYEPNERLGRCRRMVTQLVERARFVAGNNK